MINRSENLPIPSSVELTEALRIAEIDDGENINLVKNSGETPQTTEQKSSPRASFEQTAFIKVLLDKKSPEVNAQELEQVGKIKQALDLASPLQKELSELSEEAFRAYLCYTFVESSHEKEPLIAYNRKEYTRMPDAIGKTGDDNVLMLSGYAYMLQRANEIVNSSYDKASLSKAIRADILKLYSLLITGNENTIASINNVIKSQFTFRPNEIVQGQTLFEETTKTEYSKQIISSKYGSEFTIRASKYEEQDEITVENDCLTRTDQAQLNLDFNEEFATSSSPSTLFKYVREKTKRNLAKLNLALDLVSADLAEAILAKNAHAIFNVSTDLMYLHLFPNCNGRVSQLLRDSFNIAMGLYPYSALTAMSQYMYFNTPVNPEHLEFMQEHNKELLATIKQNQGEKLTKRTLANEFIKKYASTENPCIRADIVNFHQEIQRQEGEKLNY